jgi:Rad3-related DNA helicase
MWSLFQDQKDGTKELKPLVFSNQKSQEDVVQEVIAAAEKGNKIIFIRGMCGTGKSAIALNLARHFGKTSIVVPIKALQEQYTKDYTKGFYILDKKDKNRLRISSLFGRKNFKCKFLEENSETFKEEIKVKKEKNAKLFDIYQEQPRSQYNNPSSNNDPSCDNNLIPCKIEIKEKNIAMIKSYLNQNPMVKKSNFSKISEVKRMSIAPVCPYWSPLFPSEIDITFKNSEKVPYTGLNNIPFNIHLRKPGCKYYEQYLAYSNADVLIFNSLKYKLESLMNRKPQTEIEIIDECDEFLDSFANQEKISLNRLMFTLNMLYPEKNKTEEVIKELTDLINLIKKDYSSSEDIIKVSDTPVEKLLLSILKNRDSLYELEMDESSYIYHLEEVARIFYEFLGESYFSIEKSDNDSDIFVKIVTTNLEKRFKELVDKNKVLVMMSGTLHSESVLNKIFGLDEYQIIDAEIQHQGELIKCKHGYEKDCSYNSFKNNIVTREEFLKSFSKAVICAKQPTLVHITSFADLPSEYEKQQYELENLPTNQDLIRDQKLDPLGKRVQDFKEGKTKVLFTTKCSRGVDFPGETCNSIIISRFPYPNISSLFWKILKRTNPEHFMDFYMDKARRDLLQRIYRGLRSKTDRVYLLSPDIRVLNFKVH